MKVTLKIHKDHLPEFEKAVKHLAGAASIYLLPTNISTRRDFEDVEVKVETPEALFTLGQQHGLNIGHTIAKKVISPNIKFKKK